MISVPSAPGALTSCLSSSHHHNLHTKTTGASTSTSPSPLSDSPLSSPTTLISHSHHDLHDLTMKRPSFPMRSYSVTSHSSRSVQFTEEITPREMALSIVQAQYHIYHTDLSGYLAGADMVQDVLTRFALGGTSKDLYQTFKRFRPDKERIPPTPTITITTRNWRDWLGHKSYYHDYLDFFDQELRILEQEQDVSETKAEASILSPSSSTSASTSATGTMSRMAKLVAEYLTPLIPGLCASTGALIHLGYGVEFGSRLAMAEGLAYACISYQPATACFIPSNVPSSWQHKTTTIATSGATGATGATAGGVTKRSPTVSILNMVRNDKRLDGMFDAGFQGRLNVVMSSRVSLLKSYLGMWTSQVHSVEEALKDLSQTSSLLLFTATNRFGDQQQLDKHLANVLLATHAARFLIHVLPGEVEKEQLLKTIWMSLVATFVVQGRPKLSLSQSHQQQQQPVMAEVNPQDAGEHDDEDDEGVEAKSVDSEMKVPSGRWKILAQDAIHADHQIVSKIVRSLWWAEMEHGSCGGLFYDAAFRAVGDDPASDESTGPGF